jgi:Flp pilus assembly protein TadG
MSIFSPCYEVASKFGNLLKSKDGNFALLTAVIAPVVLVAGGLALDVANMNSLKGRLQAASDSVALVIATRIAKGNLSVDEAEAYGASLLAAQMEDDISRFSNLAVTPDIEIIEVISGGVSSWDIVISGSASQDTTPLSGLLGHDTMSVSITTTATTGTEEIQGALSMAVVVDVSGSMGSNLSGSTTTIETALGVSSSNASTILNYLSTVVNTYGLSEDDLTFILDNYTTSDCVDFYNNSGDKTTFLNGIGKPTTDSYYNAYLYCAYPTYAGTYFGTTNAELSANLSTVIETLPTTRLEALKTASASLYAQFDAADPTQTYVRTGISAYASSVKGYRSMEWGTSSAASYTTTLSASGGTASTDSVKWAYEQLRSSNTTETNAHTSKNGQDPSRFILFMTDGNNNRSSDDTSTRSYCDLAKNDGIEIFSVAFDAPSGGEALLSYCATSSDHYYDPDTASELIAAFKNIGAETAKTATHLTH